MRGRVQGRMAVREDERMRRKEEGMVYWNSEGDDMCRVEVTWWKSGIMTHCTGARLEQYIESNLD